jgi:hypothetical protein
MPDPTPPVESAREFAERLLLSDCVELTEHGNGYESHRELCLDFELATALIEADRRAVREAAIRECERGFRRILDEDDEDNDVIFDALAALLTTPKATDDT